MTEGAAPSDFALPLRVYYEDTDAAGVVYHANYLRFMERARTEWLSALGFDLAVVERTHAVAFAVHHADVVFRQPARLSDRLAITVRLAELGRARFIVDQDVLRAGETLAQARITLACIDPATWRPARIPAPLVLRMKGRP